jgi:hypothetical protein
MRPEGAPERWGAMSSAPSGRVSLLACDPGAALRSPPANFLRPFRARGGVTIRSGRIQNACKVQSKLPHSKSESLECAGLVPLPRPRRGKTGPHNHERRKGLYPRRPNLVLRACTPYDRAIHCRVVRSWLTGPHKNFREECCRCLNRNSSLPVVRSLD